MDWLLMLAGAILVLVGFLDSIAHTLVLRGGGPISRRLGEWTWRGVLLFKSTKAFRVLALLAGPAILLITFTTWMILLWSGWTLIFSADSFSIVSSSTREPATWLDRMYYSGFVLTTLGLGDYVAQGKAAKILTPIAAGQGFFFISLFVAYLVAVLGAVVSKRVTAFQILGLAETPEQLVIRAWQASKFDSLESSLQSLSKDLVNLAEQHLAYPSLHYFHSYDLQGSPPAAVSILDEALTLILCGMDEKHHPDHFQMRAVRKSIAQFSDTIHPGSSRAAEPPPPPDLQALRQAGVPTVTDEAFQAALAHQQRRRMKLHELLSHDGLQWSEVMRDHR